MRRMRTSRLRTRSAAVIGPLPPPATGQSLAFAVVARDLDKAGWTTRVVNLTDPRCHERASPASPRRVFSVLAAVLRSWIALARSDVGYLTVSQSRLGFLKDALISLGARAARTPLVVHAHGGAFADFYVNDPLSRTLFAHTVGRAHTAIGLSPELADTLRDVFCSRNVIFVPNCVSVPLIPPRRAPSARITVLFLSTLSPQKGYSRAVDACRRAAARMPSVQLHLNLAGPFALAHHVTGQSAPQFRSIADMAADLDRTLSTCPANMTAKYYGPVDGGPKAALLRDADILILPTNLAEGQPLAILEALRSAIPVVSSQCPGILATVPLEMHPLLCDPHDICALADRLVHLATMPVAYERYSRVAHAAALNLGVEDHIRRISNALAQACL